MFIIGLIMVSRSTENRIFLCLMVEAFWGRFAFLLGLSVGRWRMERRGGWRAGGTGAG